MSECDNEIIAIIEINGAEITIEGFTCPLGNCSNCEHKCKEIPCG